MNVREKRAAGRIAAIALMAAIASCGFDDGLISSDPVPDASTPESILTATFIDVWQGDAALFELPGGETVLIDGGDDGYGQGAVVPLLEQRGVDVIDLMILTHPHADHCGGLDEVMAEVEVLEIWENGEGGDSLDWDAYVAARDAEGASVLFPAVGHSETFGDVTLDVLHTDSGYEGENNDSLVVRISHRGVVFLTTGDVEAEAQEEIHLERGDLLGCEVIKVPHHGSWNQHEPFAVASDPEVAVISSGLGNQYGHPAEETLALYGGIGAAICRTDLAGDVEVISNGEDVSFNCN